MQQRSKYILFFILVTALFAPVAQKVFHIPQPALHGTAEEIVKDTLSFQGWFEGSWQLNHEKYCESKIGFRPWLVKIKSHLEYVLFRSTTSHVIIGKEDWLYELPYILAYNGNDFLGADTIRMYCDEIAFVRQELKKQNTELLILLAPNKARLVPQYIPEPYADRAKRLTNYDLFRAGITQRGIPFIDYNTWMRKFMDTCSYPAYNKYGIHWTFYASDLALDSLLGYMEFLKGTDITDMNFGAVRTTDQSWNSDADLLSILNLLWPPDSRVQYAYHEVTFGHHHKTRPNYMAMADSYFNGFSANGYLDSIFSPQKTLWYYNAKELTDSGFADIPKNADVAEKAKGRDFIFLLYCEPNIRKFHDGFIHDLYTALKKKQAE